MTLLEDFELPVTQRPFNTPLESGLRCLFLLDALAPNTCDVQRLVYLDYLLVHSADVLDGPASLHAHLPYRGGQWLVRRQLVSEGLALMCSRELLDQRFTPLGIHYATTELTTPFLQYLESEYARDMRETAAWIARTFRSFTDVDLQGFMTANLGRWGAEFDLGEEGV